ncbi:tRNA (guanosine(46)-N7)-methyltransferase TrmB [bacterium M21]|nr:tRNA (guanosine(46)-N7)-methyltransferase TrmB [bacterium M21]
MITDLTKEYKQWAPTADGPLELDLGCGKGSFLTQLAQRYPDRTIIGVDVMIGRLRKVLNKAKCHGLDNIQVVRCAAWPLVACHLPDNCLDRIHVLCPDPWPKKRHRKNRLLTSEFIGRLATKLKPGGILHLGTDNVPYFEFMLEAIADLAMYEKAPEGLTDIADIKTDFEARFAEEGIPVQHRAWRVIK